MLDALQKGDEIVTAGGIVGKISKLADQYATVEIAPNVEITVQRSAISQLLPKGTIKSLSCASTTAIRAPRSRPPPVAGPPHEPLSRSGSTSLIAVALVVGIVYTLPNFFPEVPAVQVSPSKASVKIDAALLADRRGGAQGRQHPVPRRGARCRPASRSASPIPTRSSRRRTCCRRSSATTTSSR